MHEVDGELTATHSDHSSLAFVDDVFGSTFNLTDGNVDEVLVLPETQSRSWQKPLSGTGSGEITVLELVSDNLELPGSLRP